MNKAASSLSEARASSLRPEAKAFDSTKAWARAVDCPGRPKLHPSARTFEAGGRPRLLCQPLPAAYRQQEAEESAASEIRRLETKLARLRHAYHSPASYIAMRTFGAFRPQHRAAPPLASSCLLSSSPNSSTDSGSAFTASSDKGMLENIIEMKFHESNLLTQVGLTPTWWRGWRAARGARPAPRTPTRRGRT